MGLRSDIQDALKEAYDEDLADAVASFNFLQVTSVSAYDASTDSYSPVVVPSLSRGIFEKVKARNIDGVNVKKNDEIITINGPDVLITPLRGMELKTVVGDIVYRIIKTGEVLSGGTVPIIYEMQVRNDAEAEVQ